MELRVLHDPGPFAELAGAWLASEPFTSNVVGVQLAGVLDGSRTLGEEDIWIAAIDDGRVVGAGMHTPPFFLFLPRLPAGVASEIALALSRSGRKVPGVNGERAAVVEFTAAWAERTGAVSSLRRATRMYRLADLRPPAATPGDARLAGEDEHDLIVEWLVGFKAEADPEAPVDVTALAERRLAAREIWLWKDEGTLVSLAAHSPPAGGVARVGPVYTPPAHRRRGYGAAVTAWVTREVLRAGADHVVLYTDLANPTSNAIYQSIGYVPDHDAEERRLSEVP